MCLMESNLILNTFLFSLFLWSSHSCRCLCCAQYFANITIYMTVRVLFVFFSDLALEYKIRFLAHQSNTITTYCVRCTKSDTRKTKLYIYAWGVCEWEAERRTNAEEKLKWIKSYRRLRRVSERDVSWYVHASYCCIIQIIYIFFNRNWCTQNDLYPQWNLHKKHTYTYIEITNLRQKNMRSELIRRQVYIIKCTHLCEPDDCMDAAKIKHIFPFFERKSKFSIKYSF